ncbi:MAG: hypothetical protein UT34_C0001G0510 [candidate division WS6 bacterium GW2011_GWF2_39_15]|uniref:Uncharacterized protein n=1 Tax=candidate division WS6 bacterium GW2011_GWF2_39_15 TaxID=1619100 RepID=A0A0G0MR09_9BACT|nr:MAG: hypothetical protein UT34_C0001G0510 [candidate division WS6 bacterium GW2011_GWF2_39_15]
MTGEQPEISREAVTGSIMLAAKEFDFVNLNDISLSFQNGNIYPTVANVTITFKRNAEINQGAIRRSMDSVARQFNGAIGKDDIDSDYYMFDITFGERF